MDRDFVLIKWSNSVLVPSHCVREGEYVITRSGRMPGRGRTRLSSHICIS